MSHHSSTLPSLGPVVDDAQTRFGDGRCAATIRGTAQPVPMICGDFELAEVMWDGLDSCLSDTQRQALPAPLHTSEPYQAILVLLTALSRSGRPLPSHVHVEFREWLLGRLGENHHNARPPMQLELHVPAADIQVGPKWAASTAVIATPLCAISLSMTRSGRWPPMNISRGPEGVAGSEAAQSCASSRPATDMLGCNRGSARRWSCRIAAEGLITYAAMPIVA